MEAGVVVINNHRRGDLHGVDEHKPFFYAALAKAVLHLRRNVDEGYPCRRVEPDFFAIAFHGLAPKRPIPSLPSSERVRVRGRSELRSPSPHSSPVNGEEVRFLLPLTN